MVDVLKLGQVHSAVSMAIDSGGCVETGASSLILHCISSLNYINEYLAVDSDGCVETGASSLILHCISSLSYISEYLAIDSGGC